jgi:uncharacterized protein
VLQFSGSSSVTSVTAFRSSSALRILTGLPVAFNGDMRWTPGGRSPHLEDRRGRGGMGGPLGIGGGLVTLILALLFGPGILEQDGAGTGSYATETGGEVSPADSAREEPMVQFVSFVLDDVQSTWGSIFQRSNAQYRPANLVLFRNGTQSGCGIGQSAMGPFYCPLDEKVYLDLGFFAELDQRFGAPGDFAQAYVIAHELGHHVQHLLGTDQKVRDIQQRRPSLANEASVRLELQADCYAGVWAHSAAQRGKLSTGDIQEGLGAASAVGDDRIQEQTTGRVNVDSFTHGSAQQRMEWFSRGYESGDVDACETFGG